MHANSFRAKFYRTSEDLLIHAKSNLAAQHCDRCHNPIGVWADVNTVDSRLAHEVDEEGVSCMACHAIQKVDSTAGNGSYEMEVPSALVDESGNRIPGEVPYEEILKHPERHKRAVMQDFYKTPEFCAVCHNASVPSSLNNYKLMRTFATYDEWQASPFSREDPLVFYPAAKRLVCQDCHMPREAAASPDCGAKDGKVASHRWFAGNTAVPFFYGYDDQLKKTVEFLQSRTGLNIDIFAVEKGGSSKMLAPVGTVPFSLSPGELITVSVVIQNGGIGHSLLPELRDLYEAWVEFEVRDSAGRMIYHSGFLQPDGSLDPHAHSFVNRPIDKDGNFVDNHEVWRLHSVGYDNTIQSGGATVVRYQFRIPSNAKGQISITATVNYRHFRQSYLNTVLGPKHPAYPVVRLASATRTLIIGENRADPSAEKEPEWKRWNDFGIANLDQPSDSGLAPAPAAQYEAAADAFSRVASLRADYPDGYSNIALARLQEGQFEAARVQLQKALAVSPANARALYYLGLVEVKANRMQAAMADFEQVVQQFPRSRDARRELGRAYLKQHRYPEALQQFQALQQIDPNDLSAHENLAIVYRRIGMPQKAAEEQAEFNDEKPDPAAPTYSFDYLRKHPELETEMLPAHVHVQSESHANRVKP